VFRLRETSNFGVALRSQDLDVLPVRLGLEISRALNLNVSRSRQQLPLK